MPYKVLSRIRHDDAVYEAGDQIESLPDNVAKELIEAGALAQLEAAEPADEDPAPVDPVDPAPAPEEPTQPETPPAEPEAPAPAVPLEPSSPDPSLEQLKSSEPTAPVDPTAEQIKQDLEIV